MSLNQYLLKWAESLIPVGTRRMAQFGDQVFAGSFDLVERHFLKKGIWCISLDNAKPVRHWCYSPDLGKPLPSYFHGQFDVVTNFGTIEHVDQSPESQYWAWRNMNDLCRPGGLMLHALPAYANWPDHCRYYYTEIFVSDLAHAVGYIVCAKDRYKFDGKEDQTLLLVAYEKLAYGFMSPVEFARLPIHDLGEGWNK